MPAASPQPQPPYFLGLDIGGSTVKSVLVDASGAPVGEMVEIPSYVKKGFAATLVQLVASADLLCKANRLKKSAIGGIGLSFGLIGCKEEKKAAEAAAAASPTAAACASPARRTARRWCSRCVAATA